MKYNKEQNQPKPPRKKKKKKKKQKKKKKKHTILLQLAPNFILPVCSFRNTFKTQV